MDPELSLPAKSEFYHRSPENLLLAVENQPDGGVIIRATTDNYSERRKELFIRELASEGFIPERFEFLTNTGDDSFVGVRWIIDNSWVIVPEEGAAVSYRRAWEMHWGMRCCDAADGSVDLPPLVLTGSRVKWRP